MNQLFQGDNLEILHNMPGGSVDLICTDPPFNTGKDWGAFDDRWEGGLDGYLKFMEARAVEMRRVLKDTGSLYLHCDPTASHYLKVMLDGVFGIDNFRNEIIWTYPPYGLPPKVGFHRRHDAILFYAYDNSVFQREYKPKKDSNMSRYNRKDENGRCYMERKGIRSYWDKNRGCPVPDYWVDINEAHRSSIERNGYPTQKPVALYERMIQASSNQHDIVLDPFAGSGTTLDAAESLGRHWIGIDIGETAIETIQERMRNRHGLEYDRDYEIIRGTEET